jgi:hypothetical protein
MPWLICYAARLTSTALSPCVRFDLLIDLIVFQMGVYCLHEIPGGFQGWQVPDF